MSSPSLWGLQTQHAFKVLSALSSSEQVSYGLDTIQDFLCELRMKSSEIFFSIYYVIVGPTKIIKRADKNVADFYKTKCFKNQSFQSISLIKVGFQV